MVNVSDKWLLKQKEMLAPEAFLELSIGVTEDGIQEEAVATSTNEATFSCTDNAVDIYSEHAKHYWATNELNLWSLDGSKNILADNVAAGYVSNNLDSGVLTVTLSEVHEQALQGVTITWSEEYGEYATKFTVNAYNGNARVATKTVTGNTGIITKVEVDIANYDRIEIVVNEWCLPQHRARIEKLQLGVDVIYVKADIMDLKHEQTGSLFSAELPKHSIEFSLDNSDGRWNPNNPTGNEKYLSERQAIRLRYGFDIDGKKEFIKAGTFYLSEWRTPSNGLTATFVARDILEYMLYKEYAGVMNGTLYEICSSAIEQANLPPNVKVHLDERLKKYSASFEDDYTLAEVLQMCANAGCCVIHQNRDGELRIEYLANIMGNYRITSEVEYAYPEYELAKPLKSIEVTYGNDNLKYLHSIADEGETQTISNPFISTEAQAAEVAQWVAKVLRFRKSISGEYRADPRADIFDRIAVESKYGVNNAVLITNIAYTYTGAFKGSYSGLISELAPIAAGYCGELYVGEV